MRPSTVLLERLAGARRAGQTFEQAWGDALGAALAAAESGERREWGDVLAGMVVTWREAFERRPARRCELALRAVAEDPDREPMPERECARCGRAISESRGRRGAPAKWCSDRCRNRAHYQRERAAVA